MPCHSPTGMGLKPVPDELVLGQFRDWNEELQTAKELPGDSIGAKIFKERSLFKVKLRVNNQLYMYMLLYCTYKQMVTCVPM